MSRIPFNHTWIESGRILAGSLPTSAEDIHTLKAMGIRAILTLTRRNLDCPGMAGALSDIRQRQYAIPDGGIADDLTMLGAITFLDECYAEGLPIYVHCRGGIGRTGTILIAYYVLQRGLSLEQARQTVSVRRNYEGNASARDQGSPQREWLDALDAPLSVSSSGDGQMIYSELRAQIEELGVHPTLGPAGLGWGIEQNPQELTTLLCRSGEIKTVLEIGTGYRAGLARFLSEVLSMQVITVDVDIPQVALQKATFIQGRSADLVEAVRGEYDWVILDGDTTYEGVRQDYQLYGEMGRIVSVHKIAGLRGCEGVAEFWRHISQTKKGAPRNGFEEVHDAEHNGPGIGWVSK